MKNESTLIATMETQEAITKVYDTGLLESFIKDGAYLDLQYLIEGKAKLDKLELGKKFYVITEGMGFYRISKEARQLSASKEYSENVAAVAVIVHHISTKYILELYLKLDKPFSPTKAFNDRAKAYEWLKKMKIEEIATIQLVQRMEKTEHPLSGSGVEGAN
jgi:hypothetical protein